MQFLSHDSLVICNVTKTDRLLELLEIDMTHFWENNPYEEICRCLETLALVPTKPLRGVLGILVVLYVVMIQHFIVMGMVSFPEKKAQSPVN